MDIKKNINKKVLVLDGATGTELQKRGMPSGVCPELWCLKNPKVIASVHSDYVVCGSDMVYTCTFGANYHKLKQYNCTDVYGTNKQLAKIARDAVGKKVFIAGDIGPTGLFVHPLGDVDFDFAVSEFKKQIKGLVDGGVDLIVIETMMDIQEARAALIAAKELYPELFVMVTMTFELNGCTLGGTSPEAALVTLQSLGADAVGCNCSAGPEGMLNFIKKMRPLAKIPLVAKPNAGLPKIVNNKTIFDLNPKEFASFSGKFIANGVALIGGCCGTTPEHIKFLKNKVINRKAITPKLKSISAVSSARKHVFFNRKEAVTIIGECINPTGKKALALDLKEGRFGVGHELAKEQELNGARILDVNVGAAGINEKAAMRMAIGDVACFSSLPISIDSSNPDVVEQALRLYPGRALINSISGEKEKLKKLLPLAKKYGAMFILLPLAGKKIPYKFRERKKIITTVFKTAKKYGFTKDDFLVDGLVMTVSSYPEAAQEALRTISWCANSFMANTVVGLSNISFGLPQRRVINSTFLVMAKRAGLTAAIANPLDAKAAKNKLAEEVLLGKDKDAKKYVGWFSDATKSKIVQKSNLTIQEKVYNAVVEGNRLDITRLIDAALAEKVSASTLVNTLMIPAIKHVGELFDRKEYFLPQLIASAQTMKKAFVYLEPYLESDKTGLEKKAVVVMATVEGDIHDIGKNIVNLMLSNYGFAVIDLGKDVSREKIIAAIKKHKPAIVGLSALMTTTMVNMKEVIILAKKEGLNCKFLVGGAVVNQPYANTIGASYAKDGVEAVKLAESMIANPAGK